MAVTLIEAAGWMGGIVTPVFSTSTLAGEVSVDRTASGRAWMCASGEHRYHRNNNAASYCAWQSLPRASVQWLPIEDAVR